MKGDTGNYRQAFYLSRHAKGVYLLQLGGREGVMGRKVILH